MRAFLRFSSAPCIVTAPSEVPPFYPVCFVLAPGHHVRDFPQMSGDP